MNALAERQQQRFQFLNKLFEETEGNELSIVSMWDVGRELDWDKKSIELTVQYLASEGLVTFRTLGGGITISHSGVVEIERALTNPEQPTEHFPAYIMSGDFRGAIINIRSDLTEVVQTVSTFPDDDIRNDLEVLLAQLNEILVKNPSDEAEAVAWTAKMLIDTSNEAKPNKTKIQITKEGLIQAAQTLAAVAPPVLEIARNIVQTIDRLLR